MTWAAGEMKTEAENTANAPLIAALQEWLLEEAPRRLTISSLLEGLCETLRAEGISIERASLGAPVLHPVAQSAYVFWDLENGLQESWFTYTPATLRALEASPIHGIYTRGEGVSIHLDRPDERGRFPICEDLWREGYTHYVAIPLRFSDGAHKTFTAATKATDGFEAGQEAALRAVSPILALVFEGLVNRNTATTLMDTYVGKRAGRRVLDGEITRGDGSRIDAVIWFSDLRDFTHLAQSRDESALLALLNEHFDILTNAIEGNSGEVLKFIGDAVLAIFPYAGPANMAQAAARAETAAVQALAATAEASEVTFGVGLHHGRVFYGNVGGGKRLDFTVIGHAVNVASRIAGLCDPLGHPLLASGPFTALSERNWMQEGSHRLKGVAEPLDVYSLAAASHG